MSEKKIDWKYLMSLSKFQRDFEIKRIAKEIAKEKDETERPNSRLGSSKNK
jgi:hypothetical protein